MMKIIIDPNAGPCPGVKRAIRMAEEALQQAETLTAIGPLIHNKEEVARLREKGLHTADQDKVEKHDFSEINQGTVFIRSHGISQALQKSIIKCNANVIDATCGIVKNIQNQIREKFDQGYQILIVGKPNHPETIGLNGYCDNNGIIIRNENDFDKIDLEQKAFLVSQTTIAQQKFLTLADKIKSMHPHVIVKDTTCRQVSKRHERIQAFAQSVDVLLLVGGKHSSNTSVLYDIAFAVNRHTYWIENSNDIQSDWFTPNITVGITGSASTPLWQLDKIKQSLMDNML